MQLSHPGLVPATHFYLEKVQALTETAAVAQVRSSRLAGVSQESEPPFLVKSQSLSAIRSSSQSSLSGIRVNTLI